MRGFLNYLLIAIEASSNEPTVIYSDITTSPSLIQKKKQKQKPLDLHTIVDNLHKRQAGLLKKEVSNDLIPIRNRCKHKTTKEESQDKHVFDTGIIPVKRKLTDGRTTEYAKTDLHTPCALNMLSKINYIGIGDTDNKIKQKKIITINRTTTDSCLASTSGLEKKVSYNTSITPEPPFTCNLLKKELLKTSSTKDKVQKVLLEICKNIFYYRCNISKLFQKLNSLQDNGNKIINQQHNKQTNSFAELKKTIFEFIQCPGELQLTDNAIFTSDNKDMLKAERKQLIDLVFSSTPLIEDDNCLYKKIQSDNKKFTKEMKKVINKTNYNALYNFINVVMGRNFLALRYYDMFVCCMTPLYKISLFFENNLKGRFEKHLNHPPLPESTFYTNYSLINTNVIFYWAIDWLYFFSNYFNIYNIFAYKLGILSLLEKLPKEFSSSLFLLLHLATKYEVGSLGCYELNDEKIVHLQSNIKVLFFQSKKLNYRIFEVEVIDFIKCIMNVYSKSIYTFGGHNRIWLIRTTSENIEVANTLETTLSPIINDLLRLIKKSDL